LLKLNLQIVLEKCRNQQAELGALKDKAKSFVVDDLYYFDPQALGLKMNYRKDSVDEAIKGLRDATDDKARREAVDALEVAIQRLRMELGKKDAGKKDAGKKDASKNK
jgi:hypothetical protein